MLARGGGALVCCFLGTKQLRDLAADALLAQRVLWAGGAAAAHGGFLSRAEGVPVESLYVHARRRGLRLVLCGCEGRARCGRCSTLRMWGRLGRPRTPGTNLGRNGVCAANLAVGLHPDRARRPPSTAGTAWAARWPRW